ncbi:MAG TPA: 4-hydroxythreonine-4-phosphate dehydrogenase PdxA [Thermoanaerobaculia bacterium]
MKPLAITLGDPSGIGAEVVFKALQEIDLPVCVFGDRNLAAQSINIPDGHPFVDVALSGDERLRFGMVEPLYGRVALASLDIAVQAIERGDCSALVTAPIQKESIAAAGSQFPGHTELLASRAGLTRYAHDFAMYFDSPSMRAVLLSVHLPLREAIAQIKADDIAALARLTTREYERIYGAAPRIAAAALNPHAGEGGRFGDEEREIRRGIEAARADGITISGPYAADTLFRAVARGKYDVVMAMYHDQALIPIKTLAFEQSVNVTLGLPYLRVSVDHGTAFDIAGKGVADPAPMRYAIEWAARHAEAFQR